MLYRCKAKYEKYQTIYACVSFKSNSTNIIQSMDIIFNQNRNAILTIFFVIICTLAQYIMGNKVFYKTLYAVNMTRYEYCQSQKSIWYWHHTTLWLVIGIWFCMMILYLTAGLHAGGDHRLISTNRKQSGHMFPRLRTVIKLTFEVYHGRQIMCKLITAHSLLFWGFIRYVYHSAIEVRDGCGWYMNVSLWP